MRVTNILALTSALVARAQVAEEDLGPSQYPRAQGLQDLSPVLQAVLQEAYYKSYELEIINSTNHEEWNPRLDSAGEAVASGTTKAAAPPASTEGMTPKEIAVASLVQKKYAGEVGLPRPTLPGGTRPKPSIPGVLTPKLPTPAASSGLHPPRPKHSISPKRRCDMTCSRMGAACILPCFQNVLTLNLGNLIPCFASCGTASAVCHKQCTEAEKARLAAAGSVVTTIHGIRKTVAISSSITSISGAVTSAASAATSAASPVTSAVLNSPGLSTLTSSANQMSVVSTAAPTTFSTSTVSAITKSDNGVNVAVKEDEIKDGVLAEDDEEDEE